MNSFRFLLELPWCWCAGPWPAPSMPRGTLELFLGVTPAPGLLRLTTTFSLLLSPVISVNPLTNERRVKTVLTNERRVLPDPEAVAEGEEGLH